MDKAHYWTNIETILRSTEREAVDGGVGHREDKVSLHEFGRPVVRAYFLVLGHFLHLLHVNRHGDQQCARAHSHTHTHIHYTHTHTIRFKINCVFVTHLQCWHTA